MLTISIDTIDLTPEVNKRRCHGHGALAITRLNWAIDNAAFCIEFNFCVLHDFTSNDQV